MKYEMNIHYPIDEMEKSQKRQLAFSEFRRPDRVPVSFCLVPRYFAKQFGIPYNDLFKSPERQYELLLQFAKYQIENIRSDMLTAPVIGIHPYFDNVTSASHFGGHIEWPENETLHAIPHIKKIDDIIDFAIPEPTAGLFGTVINWWRRMKELADETQITFDGVPGKVVIPNINLMPLGPHMIAVDLVGTDFYWWCIEDPDICKDFLLRITQGLIDAEEYVREIDPRHHAYDGYGIAEDSSTVMSLRMFREFTVPYDKMLYNRFGKFSRGMHMCGPSLHLHNALVQDLAITSFNLFGYQVKPEEIVQTMGNKVHLWGNINPMLMLSGSKNAVSDEVRSTLEILGPINGFMLGDGANVCPGTPLENINALVEVSQKYAFEKPELFAE